MKSKEEEYIVVEKTVLRRRVVSFGDITVVKNIIHELSYF
jgi:hypothetical protein